MTIPGAQSKALGQLHAGIDRASRLVDQLLTLSRLDSLDNLDDVEPVMMADLPQSAVLDIWHPAQQAGIDIRLNVNAPEVMRHGQPLLLSLLARNLLDNAVRYSPRGSGGGRDAAYPKLYRARQRPGHFNRCAGASRRALLSSTGPGRHRQRSGVVYRQAYRDVTGMRVSLGNAPEGGFEVTVSW